MPKAKLRSSVESMKVSMRRVILAVLVGASGAAVISTTPTRGSPYGSTPPSSAANPESDTEGDGTNGRPSPPNAKFGRKGIDIRPTAAGSEMDAGGGTGGGGGGRPRTGAGGPVYGSGVSGGTGGGRKGPKKPLAQPKYRTLQRLLQDLEESDYGGIGAWGEFSTNPRRRVSRSFTSERERRIDGVGGQQPMGGRGGQQQPSADWGGGGGNGAQGGAGDEYGPAGARGQIEGYWGPSSLQEGGGGGGNPQNVPVPLYRDERLVVYREMEAEMDMMDMMDMEEFDPSRIISMYSVARIGALVLAATACSYLAVVPRSAPTQQYNYLFKLNMLLVLASIAWPLVLMGIMYNPREVNVNHLIQTFFTACTSGYIGAFVSEIVVATGIRLAAFHYLEPGMVASCPEIPAIHLPWVWKEKCGARPQLFTLLLTDLMVNCIASPIIEETIKLWCYRWCSWLRVPRLARREAPPSSPPPASSTTSSSSTNNNPQQQEANGAESQQQQQQQEQPSPSRRSSLPRYYRRADSVHSTLVYMMAAALGLKAADNARRILLYTKPQDTSKPFFALARGLFPVHELCGAFTALNLVRRDILGERMSWLRVIAPAVILHSMANFRGMKPIHKWVSSAPWTEMQLQALSAPDYATALQQIWKAVWGLVWFAVLARVLGYLMYSHYLLQKQFRYRYRYPPGGGFQ